MSQTPDSEDQLIKHENKNRQPIPDLNTEPGTLITKSNDTKEINALKKEVFGSNIWNQLFSQILIIFLIISGTSLTIYGASVKQTTKEQRTENNNVTIVEYERTGHWGLIGGGLAIIAFASGAALYNYSPPFVKQLLEILERIFTEYIKATKNNNDVQ